MSRGIWRGETGDDEPISVADGHSGNCGDDCHPRSMQSVDGVTQELVGLQIYAEGSKYISIMDHANGQ